MPGGAHHRADPACPRGSEHGFSLTELIVVIVLVAIALGAALYSLSSVRRGSGDTRYAAAATTIWRGIGSYRLDNKGAPPPASELAQAGKSFTNLAGARYVRTWPEDPRGNGPLVVVSASATRPPPTGPANTVQYAVRGDSAWMAAYGGDGRVVFLRSIATGTTPEAPVG
jgi:prepilin-type N-terminal cleavage/methylation domain-containing protein